MKLLVTIAAVALFVLIGVWLWNRRDIIIAVFKRASQIAEDGLKKLAGNDNTVNEENKEDK